MSSSKPKRQSTTRTPGSPIAAATRSVDQKSSPRGSVLTELTLSALGFPGHAFEEGSREDFVGHRRRHRAGPVHYVEYRQRQDGGRRSAGAVRASDPQHRDGERSRRRRHVDPRKEWPLG